MPAPDVLPWAHDGAAAGGPARRCTSYEQGRAGAELWVAKPEARLREDVAAINRWREAVHANRLVKLNAPPPFGWMG